MLNWKKIKERYPQSYEKFVETMFPYVGVIGFTTLSLFEVRKLYYFFDKYGVFLTIERIGSNQWLYTISLSNGNVLCPKQGSRENREDVEIDGFNECFRVLNNNLELHINELND
jgi:hypothetical protein